MQDRNLTALDDDNRTWALACHLGGLGSLSSVPFAGIIAPLIIWLNKRDEHEYIDYHGKEALNFQISFAIYYAVTLTAAVILTFVLIGILLYPIVFLLYLAQIAGSIYGAIQAKNGEYFRYPLTIRFL